MMIKSNKAQEGNCDRCGNLFEIDEGYKMLDLIDRPHIGDLEVGNVSDQYFVLCRSCASDFTLWMRPDVETHEELLKDLRYSWLGHQATERVRGLNPL